MAKTLLTSALPTGFTPGAGGTDYFVLANTKIDASTTESRKHLTYRIEGTLTNLYVRIFTNSTSLDSTVRTRKNGANANLTVTIPAATTGIFTDDSSSDDVTSGDLLAFQSVSGGTGTMTIAIVSVVLNTNTADCYSMMSTDAGFINAASTTRINPITGTVSGGGPTSENAIQSSRIRKVGTFKNFSFINDANPRTTTTTFQLRLNDADTTLGVSVGEAATGIFEDTSDTVDVVVGDDVCFGITTGTGSETMFYNYIAVGFESANGMIMAASATVNAINANLTRYIAFGGGQEVTASEPNAQHTIRFPCTLSQLTFNIRTNTVSADSTGLVRINDADGNQSVNITANTTGLFIDSSNEDVVIDSDIVNFQLDTGATGTSLSFSQIIVWTEQPVENNFRRRRRSYTRMREGRSVGECRRAQWAQA